MQVYTGLLHFKFCQCTIFKFSQCLRYKTILQLCFENKIIMNEYQEHVFLFEQNTHQW